MICHYGLRLKCSLKNTADLKRSCPLQDKVIKSLMCCNRIYYNRMDLFTGKLYFNLINIHFSLRSATCFSFLYSSFTLCRSKYLLNVLCNFEQILPVALLLIPLLLQSQLSQLHQLEGQLTKRVLTKQFRFKIWCFWICTITCQKDSCAKSFKKHSCCHCI